MAEDGLVKIGLGCGGCCCLGWVIFFFVMIGSYMHLGPDDQLLIKTATGHRVVNGPTSGQFNPFQEKTKRKATFLDALQYAIVQNRLTAVARTVSGPELLFLGAYDELKSTLPKIVLERDQYVRLVDRRTGLERVEPGPNTIVPSATELTPDGVRKGVYLNFVTSVVVKNKTSGMQTLVSECTADAGLFVPKPLEEIVETRSMIQVLPHEALVVRDVQGVTRVWSGRDPSGNPPDPYSSCFAADAGGGGDGPGTAFFLPPYSKIVRMKWSDYSSQRAQMTDGRLLSEETKVEEKKSRILEINEPRVPVYQYVHMETEDRMYCRHGDRDSVGWGYPMVAFYGYRQSDFHTVPIYEFSHPGGLSREYSQNSWPRDASWTALGVAFHAHAKRMNGAGAVYEYFNRGVNTYQYVHGREHPGSGWELTDTHGNGIAFYAFQRISIRRLQEYPVATEASLYVDQYTPNKVSGAAKHVAHIDLRTQKAFYSYNVRTSDNVRMEIGGAIFWKVKNVTEMISMTANPPGDIYARCRATLNSVISNVTLIEFMESLNTLADIAMSITAADGFYARRGLDVTALELTKYKPVDEYTKNVLQEIIRETVNRTNALQKQQSSSEVAMSKLVMDISLEDNRTALIESKATNARLEAEAAGAVKGLKVGAEIAAFMDGLQGTGALNESARVSIFKKQAQIDAMNKDSEMLSGGSASVYITDNKMSLRLETPEKDGR